MLDKNNIFMKVLQKQSLYKEENGESSETPLRLGRLDSELYRNKDVITCVEGQRLFVPTVSVETLTYTDTKSYITINISNYETRCTVKQIIIRSQENNLSLLEFKELYDKIIDILNSESMTELVDLIEMLRSTENLRIEEHC